jgi:hypothetical protein
MYSRLKLLREIIVIYSENRKKFMDTLCGHTGYLQMLEHVLHGATNVLKV